MRKLIAVTLFAGLLLCVGAAQAEERAEVFGGYQFTHLEPSFNANGWNGQFTYNLSQHFGIAGDFSGAYKDGFHFYTYSGGPVVKMDLKTVKPFAHALFGGGRASFSGVSNSGMTMMFGGGFDIGHGKLAFRAAQIDWMYNHFDGVSSSKNLRMSTGLLFRF